MAKKRHKFPTVETQEQRAKRISSDPTLREITELAQTDSAISFVRGLAQYFTGTEVVLILRAAKESKLI